MHSPGPSASDIQSHLYASFLQASTYDVALRVSGTWHAIYKLHRVVLIQSGFFRSLFTGGFSESAVKLVSLRNGTDEISVIFDDLNITRPAFEVCISRLYGGGPALHVSSNLIPTTNHPLTPPFSGAPLPEDIPVGTHPASPLFLQSLLATAIYLSIPTVASQALSLILKTVGPTTVLQYLNFACGKTIGYHSKPGVLEPQAAVGLENVGNLFDPGDAAPTTSHPRQITRLAVGVKAEPFTASEDEASTTAPPIWGSSDSSDEDLDDLTREMTHHYGAVSDKIGEACSCWLARWASDMLRLETSDTVNLQQPSHQDTRARSKSLSVVEGGNNNLLPTSFAPKTLTASAIWGRNGLNAEWVAAIISADTLFVKNERERYNFARSVVEFRRKDGILDEEEIIWTNLFKRGIYFAHMTFEDLSYISQDVSPTTNRIYAELSTLQAAHWTQSVLRQLVTQRPNSTSNSPASTASRDKELAITLLTSEILSKITSVNRRGEEPETATPFFPVLGDSSLRIGDNGMSTHTTPAGSLLSMDALFSPSQEPPQRHPRTPGHDSANSNILTTEGTFFGIMTPQFSSGQACVDSDRTGKSRWSPYPPCRFSVEFWDVDLLKEKSRLHSQTIWYAGSLFNVYVQIVRKKGLAQLGIYLHRQSHVDSIPASSTPHLTTRSQSIKDRSIVSSFERPSHLRQPSLPSMLSLTNPTHYSPSIHAPSRSSTPSTTQTLNSTRPSSPPSPSPSPSSSPPLTSPLGSSTIPFTVSSPAPHQPYRDPRSSISAYFAISCASATGSSQTRFSSSPDIFSVSQSWGWKSSTLRTEDFVEVGNLALPNDVSRNDEVSLRATVVLGLV